MLNLALQTAFSNIMKINITLTLMGRILQEEQELGGEGAEQSL